VLEEYCALLDAGEAAERLGELFCEDCGFTMMGKQWRFSSRRVRTLARSAR
jgi:hypothetical protein